jgi:MFS transporter, DHA1 family, multidrug resistance protein
MAENQRWEDDLDRRISGAEADANNYGRASNEIERVLSASSVSTSSNGSVRGRPVTAGGMSRVSTQRDLERHPTELDRIQTARSQHSNTVGAGAGLGKSNTRTRDSRRPMPPMGAGKSLPPLLDKDDYVVEFDGPDDPLHAQNWPLNKK